MLRRWFVLVPAMVVTAAVLGARFSDRAWLVAAAAAAAALLLAVAAERSSEQRLRRLADRVEQYTKPDRTVPAGQAAPPGGSPQWRRLVQGLDGVGDVLRERVDELADQRARVERLLDRLPLAILLFTPDGLAYANPAARHSFSLDGSEARTPLQVLGVAGLAEAVGEAQHRGRTVAVEVQRNDRELVGRASVTATGEVMLVVTDLTESRRIEQVRRDFVTNASHELKTPVAGMQALSESLAMAIQLHPDRAQRMVQRLQVEAARLAQLVRDLLDLSRLEESTQRSRQRVDLAEIVREQIERLEVLAAERQIGLTMVSADPAPLIAVPEDLRLIAANLLDNAVVHNRPGGTVRVDVGRHGGEVVLEVSDNGLGISESEQDRIFERFYRVDKGRSRDAGGTGLGLAIVRHAAQQQGGRVTVRSVLGQGSTFRVVLPVDGGAAT